MADECDRAQVLEERHRELSIASVLARSAPPPLMVDGVRVCTGCGEPIEAPRLAAVPHATRCVECQQRIERTR